MLPLYYHKPATKSSVDNYFRAMLTKKQELAIEYHLQGMDKTNAVFKAFECQDKQSAAVIATKLFKQQKVKDRLSQKQTLIDEKTAQMTADFLALVKKNIPPLDVIKKLKENLEGKDKRIVDAAIDKYLKIIGGYKDKESKLAGMFDNVL